MNAARTQWDRRIEQLEAKITRLERATSQPFVYPGAFVTGRSGRSASLNRKCEREGERRAREFSELQQARQRLAYWTARRAAFLAGEVHANGQPCADAPSRVRRQAVEATLAAFLRATLSPGDTVYNSGGNPMTVRRVNAKSISTTLSTWRYEEITPAHPDGRAMTSAEFLLAFRAWKAAQAAVAAGAA